MADLLISGVELPERDEILCLFSDGSLGLLDADYGFYPVRPIDCAKAVSLPEGHGKLIDGHKLYRALFATECGNIAADRDSEGWPKVLTYEAVKKAIQDATIIVPAEGGEADGNS